MSDANASPTPPKTKSSSPTESPLFAEHPHHLRTEERMGKLEDRADKLMLVIIFIFGAAMAIGLLAATGHVTW